MDSTAPFDRLGPPTVFPGSGNAWAGALISQNGDFTNDPYQDLVAIQKGTLFASDYPLITCIGDANGDGIPDLYATTAAGGLVFIPGLKGIGFSTPQPVRGTGTNWNDVTAIG